MRTIIGFIILIALSPKLFGGWFDCYNYTGNLNKQKIDLSIQFLGDDKKRIEGVYKYNKFNTPIKLVGLEKNGDTLRFSELLHDSIIAKISLINKGDSLVGKWTSLNSNIEYPIKLKLISKLVDTLYGSSFSNVDLLFRQSTDRFYFVGNYSLKNNEYRACMDTLKVIEKTTNKIIYRIYFSNNELFNRAVGNIMTVIYENLIDVSVDKNGKIKQIRLTADLGRMGCDFPLNFDSKSNSFMIDENDLNSYAP